MSKTRLPYVSLIIVGVVIVLVIAVIMWFKPKTQGYETQIESTTLNTSADTGFGDSDNEALSVTDATSSKFTTGLENLPRSLQGSDIDGEIIIDDNKQLVVTQGLRRLFDYFLSALGEEDAATILNRTERYIRHHTPEPAASQAVALFNQYVSYLKQLSKIEDRYGNLQRQATQDGALDLNMVAQRKQDVSTLRQQHFNHQTITAFFGEDDDYDEYSMAMIEIEQNEQMLEDQKSAARQDYISRMPDNTMKQNLEQRANISQLIARTEQMKARGASPEALYNMRRELVGAPAATRLAKLDIEDADFDQRFTQYQTQKQQLLIQNPDNAQSQINQLEQQLFSDTERKRLSGYAALKQETSNLN